MSSINPFRGQEAVVLPARNMLELGVEGYAELPAEERRHRLAACQSSGGIKDELDLKLRIAEYIHIRTLNGMPSKRVAINQRFAAIARKMQTTPMRILNDLIVEKYVEEFERRGKKIVVSFKVYEDLCKEYEQNLIEIEALLERWFTRDEVSD